MLKDFGFLFFLKRNFLRLYFCMVKYFIFYNTSFALKYLVI
jgi:hypothetical protein